MCLWNDDDGNLTNIVGKEGILAGWGKIEDGQTNYVPNARKIAMPVVSQKTCLDSNSRFKELVSDSTFCAGSY